MKARKETMDEGSVEVDTGVLPSMGSDESSEVESSENSQNQNNQGGDGAEVANKGGESNSQSDVKYTEKGTKLDPNPQSAVHQELANERKLRSQYETVLKNPEYLKRYAQEMGLTIAEAKQEIKDAKESEKNVFSADKFQTADDIARALNELQTNFSSKVSNYEKTIQELQAEIRGIAETRKIEKVATNLSSDVSAIREKYPELDPKNPSYDPELEKEIGELYHELDFDASVGVYKGQISIAKLADKIMSAAGKARRKGSEDAQTIIKERSAGKIVTSGKAVQKEAPESGDAVSTIASRIQRAMGK